MANKFKYNKTGTETDSIFKGNWAIDTTAPNSGGGPSSTTGLYNGAEIPNGGYTIYSPIEVYTATTDEDLLGKVRDLGGDWSSVSAALTWVADQPDFIILNKAVDNIVANDLVLNLDASNISSFVDSQPTTNLWVGNIYNWTSNATMYRNITEIAPYDANYEVVKIVANNPGSVGMSIPWTTSIPNPVVGDLYTHTAWMYLASGTYCKVGQHWNPWNYGVPNYIPLNTWTRVSYTLALVDTTHASIANNYSTDGVVYVTKPQYEKQPAATPFVYGTRLQNTEWYNLNDKSNYYTLYALTYPESGQTPANRNGITLGYNNITDNKLFTTSRDMNYFVFNEDTNTWVPDSYFNGERISGHCYDTYDGAPNQHEQFNTDFDNIHATFPNSTHILIASHAAERFWTNAGMLQRLQSIGLPDGVAGNARPEFILAGKVNKQWLTKFAYENVSSVVANMNLSLPMESAKGILTNGVEFNNESIIFDGINDYIPFPSILNKTYINNVDRKVTISMWLNPDVHSSRMPFSTGQVGNDRIYYWTAGGFNLWRVGNFISSTSTPLPAVGNWYHTTLVIENGTVTVYLNGELDYTGSFGSFTTADYVTLGKHGVRDEYYYDGKINSVLVYDNKALASEEVLQNFNAQKNRFGL